MRTFYFEAMHSNAADEFSGNWGKFLVGVFDVEWTWETQCLGYEGHPILPIIGTNPEAVWVFDLQTGEGALFNPHGLPAADLDKHRVWVCPMFQPFLEWLYTRLRGSPMYDYPEVLTRLSAEPVILRDAPFAMAGYRRKGPE